MSRSNPTNELQNPAKRFFEWAGSTGQIKFYDKSKQENIFIEPPFPFIVLDQLNTITGYSDELQSGIWSNEVRDLRVQPLTIKTKNGVYAKGTYDMLKGLSGSRFTKSIYIAYYDENKELVIGNIQASGSCLSAWIEFTKGKNVYEGAIAITKAISAKKGATKYFVPVFDSKPLSPETDEKAMALDKELQEYLEQYFAQARNEPKADTEETATEETSPFEEPVVEEVSDDEIPF